MDSLAILKSEDPFARLGWKGSDVIAGRGCLRSRPAALFPSSNRSLNTRLVRCIAFDRGAPTVEGSTTLALPGDKPGPLSGPVNRRFGLQLALPSHRALHDEVRPPRFESGRGLMTESLLGREKVLGSTTRRGDPPGRTVMPSIQKRFARPP